MVERADLERKATLDMDSSADRLKLVREVAAMMNSAGGRIVLGVMNDGTEVGLDVELAEKLDPARLGDLVDNFISPDRVEIAVETRAVADRRLVIELSSPPALLPPVVLSKAGNYVGADGKQSNVFASHSVYVRRSTKAEPARWEDYRRWREEAIERARSEIIARLTMVVEAPSDSRIRVITDDEVRDEPNFFLNRSAEVFRHRPDRLLSGSDLAYLWLHRSVLDLDDTAKELIFHSALRKRATLWLWLATLGLSPEQVERLLNRSLELRDRDKSDAARSILQVSAAYLNDSEYERIRDEVAASEYAHKREAAHAMPDRSTASAALRSQSSLAPDGRELSTLAVDELTGLAEELLKDDFHRLDGSTCRDLPAPIDRRLLFPRHTGGELPGAPGFQFLAGISDTGVLGARQHPLVKIRALRFALAGTSFRSGGCAYHLPFGAPDDGDSLVVARRPFVPASATRHVGITHRQAVGISPIQGPRSVTVVTTPRLATDGRA